MRTEIETIAEVLHSRGERILPKIIIAVHGIGDQVRNTTIQQVATQFCRHYGQEVPISLGEFDAGPVMRDVDAGQNQIQRFYFGEVYWANIPRKIANDGYILEDTKRWAGGIAGRLRESSSGRATGVNYSLVRQVVEEMVEAIGVLERLTFLADKAGMVKFNLNKVLVDYLDDVQVVAEFPATRQKIVDEFSTKLEFVHRMCPEAGIYIVAHSEGTVVSFLGLLAGIWAQETPDWLRQVRGYLTIGSPIDKHLVLWPELFPRTGEPVFNPRKPEQPDGQDMRIKWRNYYDYGDPVGFELDGAREWLSGKGVTAFEFDPPPQRKGDPDPGHDNGFARYSFPGKAHNDYWKDSGVFDHFIRSVVEKPVGRVEKPENRLWARFVAYGVSYGLALSLLAAAVFFVIRSARSFDQEAVQTAVAAGGATQTARSTASTASGLRLVRDVVGIALLIAGMTVLSRIPKLVNPRLSTRWLWIALAIFATCALLFWTITSAASRKAMGKLPEFILSQIPPAFDQKMAAWDLEKQADVLTPFTIGLAFLIAVGTAWAGRRGFGMRRHDRSWGTMCLLVWGSATAAVMLLLLLNQEGSGEPSLWPILLALGVFLYLWWLTILLFDLLFVWHRYIRHEAGPRYLERVCGVMRSSR